MVSDFGLGRDERETESKGGLYPLFGPTEILAREGLTSHKF